MPLPYQQFNRLLALGLKTAAAVRSGECQEPERHIPVSGQIRGYLRWYGSLTDTKGYWPLAEAIATGLQEGKFTHKTFMQVTEPFAAEWGSTSEHVREEMTATACEAVDSRPDFAVLVMGGAPDSKFLLTFIEASMRWLKHHTLILRPTMWRQKEAVWVNRRAGQPPLQVKVERSTPYISAEDFLIVSELHRGLSKKDLAQKLGYTPEDLTALYQQTVERAQLIISKINKFQVPAGRKEWSIADYLKAMGLPPLLEEMELEAAIRLAAEQPDLLEHMVEQFYPALGKAIGRTEGAASHRIRATIDKLSKNPDNAEFFRFAGLDRTNIISTKKFIQAFLRYTGQ